MSDLLGIIVPLRKFLSSGEEEINVTVDGKKRGIIKLQKEREYSIPDFQREIRWDKENVSLLIDDIKSGPKYLGNVILTQHSDSGYSIIDGQQRITILTMILSSIKMLHDKKMNIIEPCELRVESFEKFGEVMKARFEDEKCLEKEILQSDKLHQLEKYRELWGFIKNHEDICDQQRAKIIFTNLGKSNINIILNRSDDIADGIRYFIDVNLKGRQLDTEDIFKSYLFGNDSSEQVRSAWYNFKTNVSNIEKSKMKYSLLSILEHYFYCDLYADSKYKGMEYDKDFLLKKEFITREDKPKKFRKGTHLIEIIDDNQYMLGSLQKVNEIIEIMLNIINSDSTTVEFKELFKNVKRKERIDPIELQIMHNIMGKILKDEKLLPKALMMKYILTVLLGKDKRKEDYRKIYGVYLLSVLFVIFEDKKSKNVLLSILKANEDTWYIEANKQIKSYFSPDRITDRRLLAQYKLGSNEEEENYKYRCKSLATIYNFFVIDGTGVSIQKKAFSKLNTFINDDEKFSMEHFIVSNTPERKMTIVLESEEQEYCYDEDFYKKYVDNLFNFIFIEKKLNSELGNQWLPSKMKQLKGKTIECEYSKMVLKKLGLLESKVQKAVKNHPKDELDLFFSRDFKEYYIEFAKNVLDTVIGKFKD